MEIMDDFIIDTPATASAPFVINSLLDWFIAISFDVRYFF